MALKIRLRQQGRNNRPFFRLVLADVRSPRDGKYIEGLGWYNPFEEELDKSLFVKADRLQYWISQGAIVSENAESLINKVAPEVLQFQREKVLAHRAKVTQKRRDRRRANKQTTAK